MYSSLLFGGWRCRVLRQLDDAARDTLQFAHVLAAFANYATDLLRKVYDCNETKAKRKEGSQS